MCGAQATGQTGTSAKLCPDLRDSCPQGCGFSLNSRLYQRFQDPRPSSEAAVKLQIRRVRGSWRWGPCVHPSMTPSTLSAASALPGTPKARLSLEASEGECRKNASCIPTGQAEIKLRRFKDTEDVNHCWHTQVVDQVSRPPPHPTPHQPHTHSNK